MAVSHSFASEDIEDGGGKETDADRKQNNIKHGDYLREHSQLQEMQCLPRVHLLPGAPRGAETESGSADRSKCIVRR